MINSELRVIYGHAKNVDFTAKEANMRKPSPGEKELITPDEAISFYTLSIRKTRALMKEETNFIVKYYDGRSLIIRREFEKYLENHPELRRR